MGCLRSQNVPRKLATRLSEENGATGIGRALGRKPRAPRNVMEPEQRAGGFLRTIQLLPQVLRDGKRKMRAWRLVAWPSSSVQRQNRLKEFPFLNFERVVEKVSGFGRSRAQTTRPLKRCRSFPNRRLETTEMRVSKNEKRESWGQARASLRRGRRRRRSKTDGVFQGGLEE